jgi:hypothetical protein
VPDKLDNAQLLDGQLDRAIDPEYAAVSTMAVVSLLFSLLGIVAFWAPSLGEAWLVTIALLALPLLGFLLGVAAVRKIRRSEGVLSGLGLAVAGILVGGAVTIAAAALHIQAWQGEKSLYEDLRARSYGVVDDILADRYEKVYQMMPSEFRRQQAPGPEAFRAQVTPFLQGAGKLVRWSLLSLPPPMPIQEGGQAVKATIHVELERRYLDMMLLWYRKTAEEPWQLAGIGGQETFESMGKFGDREALPAPKEPGKDASPQPAPAKPGG